MNNLHFCKRVYEDCPYRKQHEEIGRVCFEEGCRVSQFYEKWGTDYLDRFHSRQRGVTEIEEVLEESNLSKTPRPADTLDSEEMFIGSMI